MKAEVVIRGYGATEQQAFTDALNRAGRQGHRIFDAKRTRKVRGERDAWDVTFRLEAPVCPCRS